MAWTIGISVFGILVFLGWSLFRAMIKDGKTTTKYPYLFLLKDGGY